MPTPAPPDRPGFSDLVFSDLARFRGEVKPSWPAVLIRCLTIPGILASLIIRAQQCLFLRGHKSAANILRTVSSVVLGADFAPGMSVGRGLMLAHPTGVVIGHGLVIGDNVTFAAGVTAAARYPDDREQDFATICDGAIIGAHAVLVGGVRIGTNAMVGANSVVLKDVPDNAVVLGVPARQVGTRETDA
jgi:serine O-acetyltransferase